MSHRLFLPRHGLWHSVQWANGQRKVPRRPFFGLLFCRHAVTEEFVWVDHESNPPSYQEVYQGRACASCGRIRDIRLVY